MQECSLITCRIGIILVLLLQQVRSLLMKVCDETEIAELRLKVNTGSIHANTHPHWILELTCEPVYEQQKSSQHILNKLLDSKFPNHRLLQILNSSRHIFALAVCIHMPH